MPRFNVPATTATMTVNRAGGEAFMESPKLALVSLLLTSFANDQFYRSAPQTFDELKALLQTVPLDFAAKAGVYARCEFGMRSITHILAAELAHLAKGQSWMRPFINEVVYRPDDMTEILAYYLATYGKPLPNALKDGLALAFGKFSTYQIARYRASDKKVSLVDVVNLCHPKPNERNAEASKALVHDTLRNEETWEAMLSGVGEGDDEGKEERKAAVWSELIASRKIGYFALLRNLRNIMEQAPDILDKALVMLVDEALIRKSLVLPFRYQTAITKIAQVANNRRILIALAQALDIAVKNVPEFPGTTLIAVDNSGSMRGKSIDIASLFGATLYKAARDADVLVFSDDATLVTNISPLDSVVTIANALCCSVPAGTNFHSIFQRARRAYDRIVILSDMQGWIGTHAPTETFRAYKAKYNANPKVFSFDLAGQGTLQFPEPSIYCLAGFSEKVFDIMKLLEEDRQALIHRIEAIQFGNP